jgi:hypothetical protein
MKPPEISPDRVSALALPRLDPAAIDLRAARRGPEAEWFSWIERMRATLPTGEPAAKGRPAAAPAGEGVRLGPFVFVEKAGRVSVRLDGEERWAVDTKAFTGTTLSLTVKNGVAEIVLADALYPGTSIPADLRARIWLENGVWMLRLRLKLGGFDATLPFQSWLARVQPAVSVADLDATCLRLGAASALVARGPAVAAFTPDWLLAVAGADAFEVEGVKEHVTADLALIALVPPGAPAVLLPATFRRTLILLGSLEQFPLLPELGPGGPEAVLDDFRFDTLAFEAGVDPSGAAWRALIARSVNDHTTMGLVPGGDLRATDGRPFRIPVVDPIYVVLFDQARTMQAFALVAQGPPQPVWMHGPTCSLLLARSREVPVVSVFFVPGQPQLVNCRLEQRQLAFHLEGLLVDPAALRAEVVFTWAPPPTPLPANSVHVEIDAANGVAIVRLPQGTTTSVVRRDDFLALGFEFRELAFEGRGPVGTFRPPAGKTPHLVVVAQAQSIGEEAVFEADPSYPVTDSDAKKIKNSPSPNVLPPPPVKALLAKPSRLAFGLPQAIDHLALSPDELLDWNRLTPSLAPTALPGEVMLARAGQPTLFLPPPSLRDEVLRRPRLVEAAPPPLPPTAAVGEMALLPARSRRPFDVIDFPFHVPLKPAPPTPTQTAIEAPFRLLVSPNAHGAWKHAASPVTHDGRTELWHTRLAVRAGEAILDEVHPLRTLRAIWSRDHDLAVPPGTDPPFLMSLDKDDRFQLVHLTSDYELHDSAARAVPPRPVGVRRFMLSALGAWIDTEFGIEPPAGFSVEEWRHRATMGRDHYVRVVYKGFLFPFGHRASLVKVTERKIELGPDGVPTAYLRQRMYIIVRERERTYPPADDPAAYAHAGRETPFRRVRITTTVTPNLDPPKDSPLGPLRSPAMIAFWPRVAKGDFRFHLKAWDWEDREADFLAPLAFVRADYPASGSPPNFTEALAAFDAEDAARRTYGMGGQQVALAETDAGSRSKTSLETQSVTCTVLAPASGKPEPPCYPRLAQASVFLPPLRQMAGPGAGATATPVTIDHYVDKGYDPADNRAKLFAAVVGPPPALDYGASGTADKAGGVVTPSLDIRGITRELGVVGDASPQFAKGTFTPASFFPDSAKLLGGISLKSLLATVGAADFLGKTPALVTENTETAVRTRLDWETTDLVDFSVFRRQRLGVPARLVLHSELLAKKDGTPPVATVAGRLTEFTIDFGAVIEVGFAELAFTSVAGKKPDVHVVIGKKDGKDHIEFKGPLAFVKTIGDHLDLGGFTDPPFLDVGPSGVQVGYSLAIPTVAVGIFSLQNLALGARLMLPFTGEPVRLRFNLSERQNPFLVSVAPFGGGGFFALAVGVDGVEQLEVSVEFGGNLAIDLGVASGGVYVMAGIYVKIKLATPEESLLTGYVRMGGSLQVLGIIAVSMEFYLGISYSKPKAWGEARVTVKVEVLFISKSVTVTARREFAGGEGDPPFGELMPQPRWAEYAAAFAA